MSMTLPEMTKNYVAIRDAKGTAKKAFDKETERMTAALVKLEGMMLDLLNTEGADSIKTEFGTVFTKQRSNCTVKDREAFYDFAVKNNMLGIIDMKANAKNVREVLSEGTEIPGIKFTEATVLSVRRA